MQQFNAEWGGWRYPFWISILLVAVSIYIRLKMKESPLFSKLKAEGKTSVNPLKESFQAQGQFQNGIAGFVWRSDGPGCDLVYGPVLCTEFSGNKMQY